MKKYICQRCGYTTNRKFNLKNHINRKFRCELLPSKTISKNTLLKKYKLNTEVNTSILKKMQPNVSQKRMTVSQLSAKCLKKKFICCYCSKKFTTRQAKFKHEKDRCKMKEKPEQNTDNQMVKKDMLINKLILQVEKLLDNNLQNFNNNNIHSNNKITNNIMVNNYGEENINYITEKVLKKLIYYPASAISKLIAMKHFNPKYPENHNIKITNIHDKFAKRYKNGKWSIEDKKAVIGELVDDGFAHYDDFKNLKGDELANKIMEKLSKIEFFFDNNKEQLEKKTEITVINGTKDLEV